MIKILNKKSCCEYWINLSDIIISKVFMVHKPRRIKFLQKLDWYLKRGKFQSPILLDHNFVLKDGYTSYLIAKKFDLGKVPVYFE